MEPTVVHESEVNRGASATSNKAWNAAFGLMLTIARRSFVSTYTASNMARSSFRRS